MKLTQFAFGLLVIENEMFSIFTGLACLSGWVTVLRTLLRSIQTWQTIWSLLFQSFFSDHPDHAMEENAIKITVLSSKSMTRDQDANMTIIHVWLWASASVCLQLLLRDSWKPDSCPELSLLEYIKQQQFEEDLMWQFEKHHPPVTLDTNWMVIDW